MKARQNETYVFFNFTRDPGTRTRRLEKIPKKDQIFIKSADVKLLTPENNGFGIKVT